MVCKWARFPGHTWNTTGIDDFSSAWTLGFSVSSSLMILSIPSINYLLQSHVLQLLTFKLQVLHSLNLRFFFNPTVRWLHFSFPSLPSDSPTAAILWLSWDLKFINSWDLSLSLPSSCACTHYFSINSLDLITFTLLY